MSGINERTQISQKRIFVHLFQTTPCIFLKEYFKVTHFLYFSVLVYLQAIDFQQFVSMLYESSRF
uniref:Uncharacterized protein n=1 Tax=Anguilla anguilla TaxID=7936 RepID=A0A0E9PKY1_ANGAN